MSDKTNGDPLDKSVQFVRGVGPKRAPLLEKLDLHTVRDLLFYLPRDILDLTDVRNVDRLEEGKLQTVRGKVVDIDGRELSGGRTLSAVLLDCDGAYVRGVWFNQPWVLRAYQLEKQLLFSGKPKRNAGRWEFTHPRVQELDEEDGEVFNGLLPRYGLTEGLRMHEMRRIMRQAVESHAEFVEESLPSDFRATHNLSTLAEALHELHLPSSRDEYESGRRRILFDDLFEFQLGLALRRQAWSREQAAPSMPTTAKIDSRIRRLFPFQFTAGQNEAIRQICEDLFRTRAMHRLLQAEVGAGKTVVAIYAMLVAVAAGCQTALMTPTEALAWQHWNTLESALSQSRVNRLLLTGALSSSARDSALERLRTGEVNLVVGTQALIQRDVAFHKLGLVVIDEQHKFGVAQRAKFSQEELSPHVLVMTATPIPRSLCMTQFGDLDVTTIKELPPGRQPVVTSRITAKARRRAWDFVRKQLREGRQAYIVCPRIESQDVRDSGADESSPNADYDSMPGVDRVSNNASAGAEEVFKQLSSGELAEFRVGMVHGRMDREIKAETLAAFHEGDLQVLVSTTVIEVGIDVPNATLMVIYQAERFGLAQLHQLRGRIARGKFQGYCFLFSESESSEAVERLEAAEANSDGFKIAEIDFEMRGPGDVLGTRQHGDMPLRAANLLRDAEILNEARHAAFALVDGGKLDEEQFSILKARVLSRFGKTMSLPQSG